MRQEPVEVYCDAGISPAELVTPTRSRISSTLTGRIIVLIPSLDYGCIEQVKEGFSTKKGNPSPNLLEVMAVRKGRDICVEKRLDNFVILTDISSIDAIPDVPEVRYLEPGRLQLASLFLQRIIDRPRYLRRSSRKSITRPPPDRIQNEIFRLFTAERSEFKLSESPLWNRIQTQIAAAKGVGQERLAS